MGTTASTIPDASIFRAKEFLGTHQEEYTPFMGCKTFESHMDHETFDPIRGRDLAASVV
jgi:hypothetical protein